MVLGDPLPVPSATVDGWSLSGTVLGGIRGDVGRELATYLHGMALGVDTPWTYLRCAEILEECGHARMSLTALDAWLSHPAAVSTVELTREIGRAREKLRARLARMSLSDATGPKKSS